MKCRKKKLRLLHFPRVLARIRLSLTQDDARVADLGAPKEPDNGSTRRPSLSSRNMRLDALRGLLQKEINDKEISILAQIFQQPDVRRRIEEHQIQTATTASPVADSFDSESIGFESQLPIHPLDTNPLDIDPLDTAHLNTLPLHKSDDLPAHWSQPLHRQVSIPPGVVENFRNRQIFRERIFL